MKALEFKGNGGEYFKIWIVNLLLMIVTLGFYYPWAKVRMTRYFNGNTAYEGRTFDYHATGKQLFLGYVIGLVLFIAYVVLTEFVPVLAIALPLLLFVAIPWLILRSLMFNARMTSFSNVRFSFAGELGKAYSIYMGLPILSGFALYLPILIGFVVGGTVGDSSKVVGIATIFMITGFILGLLCWCYMFVVIKKKSIEFRVGGLRFGQGIFSVDIVKKKLFAIYAKSVLIGILVFVISMGLMMVLVLVFDLSIGSDELAYRMQTDPVAMVLGIIFYLIILVGFLFISSYIYTRQRQYVYANTLLDGKVRFKSTLKARSLFFIMITNMLLVICTLGFGQAWALVRMARYVTANTYIDDSEVDIDSYLTQKVEEQSAIGEEIGDAFDVDAGIGF